MAELKQPARKLVKELTHNLNLSEVDAMRAAFVPLALQSGWPKAKIARWLGVTRERVHQRVRKYERYAHKPEYPVLAQTLSHLPAPKPDTMAPVVFKMKDWEDRDFAVARLNDLCK